MDRFKTRGTISPVHFQSKINLQLLQAQSKSSVMRSSVHSFGALFLRLAETADRWGCHSVFHLPN